jgi:predicted nucleotidyltransferase component of viral defense system
MAKTLVNMGASVRARLLTFSKEHGQTFDLVLTRYAIERLLYRLSKSPEADRFVLKGATLVMTWFDEPYRGTQDLDLLGHGDPAPEQLLALFKTIFAAVEADGVNFDVEGAAIRPIRENTDYGGFRIRTTAEIGGARLSITIDIGFGDATEPPPEPVVFPALLDMPAPKLRGYARETVIAEKFEAIVSLGRANSRMKDYFDIWMLSRTFSFEPGRLRQATHATFERRGTAIPTKTPDGLTAEFAADPLKQRQWAAFTRDLDVDAGELTAVVADLTVFLMMAIEIKDQN